jgi:hypothetical protein
MQTHVLYLLNLGETIKVVDAKTVVFNGTVEKLMKKRK